MRLLHTSQMQLEEFTPDKIPCYAILSHRWESSEISFNDFQSGAVSTKAAWKKLQRSCQQAQKDRIPYIWIDSCCIDKSSSAELSESVNSMFNWYRHAHVCYAYLSDVPDDDEIRKSDSKFASSAWFDRGWTLQELLAPREMIFFSHNWRELGEKKDLIGVLASITRIPDWVLGRPHRMFDCSIAQRMSWASRRKTTRPEDMAYALMGIFDVNMSLLYGEGGTKAFLRLQEEIMKISDDTSIFAWVDPKASPDNFDTPHGLLATSIEHFADSHNIKNFRGIDRPPYEMTNKGIRIDFTLLGSPNEPGRLALLDCVQIRDGGDPRFVAVHLRKEFGRLDGDIERYVRVKVESLPTPPDIHSLAGILYATRGNMQTVYITQRFQGFL